MATEQIRTIRCSACGHDYEITRVMTIEGNALRIETHRSGQRPTARSAGGRPRYCSKKWAAQPGSATRCRAAGSYSQAVISMKENRTMLGPG